MRPTHSQMLTRSDDSRANIAGVPALIVSGILVFGFDFDPLGSVLSMAASMALPHAVINIFLVTSGSSASIGISAALGIANVIASWAVLVYSFALEFMPLDLSGGGSAGERQLEFEMEGPREFGAYLTCSVLSSTMTAALPGRAVSRKAWRMVRTNVIVAFDSVVVATLVSMILSYVM